MRILIDFTQIPLRRAGAGVYAENLVIELPPFLGVDDELWLLLQSDETVVPGKLAAWKKVRTIFVPSQLLRNRALLMLFEQLILPWILYYHRIDVVHSLHYTLPVLSSAARVVTFHDLTMLLRPQLHTSGRRLIMPLYMKLAWRLADVIVFVSESTRQDAEKLMPSLKSRLNLVVPLGVGPDLFRPVAPQDVDCQLAALNISKPYVLFIGTLEPRKNLVRVVEAFDQIAPRFPEHVLILAGKLGWAFEPVLDAIQRSPFRDRIKHLGYISEESKKALLAGGELLAYPSLYEGFGLPVLEAMAAGIPVITSNVSSLPEVAGSAALMVDPDSVESLSNAMERLLSDPGLAQRCRSLGLERAKAYSWANTAALTFKAYQAAYSRRHKPIP